jgi:hypothetical protein
MGNVIYKALVADVCFLEASEIYSPSNRLMLA